MTPDGSAAPNDLPEGDRRVDLAELRRAAQVADPIKRARALTQLMADASALVAEAAWHRRLAVAEARDQGATLQQIATQLGVSPGRVSQIISATSKGA